LKYTRCTFWPPLAPAGAVADAPPWEEAGCWPAGVYELPPFPQADSRMAAVVTTAKDARRGLNI
jgi:hypothetical protein